ncbi:MAG: aldo/keto reductase [Candidatus Cyclobacteriaceae bacterium M3_2C_046]
MKLINLPHTDLKVSVMAFGAWPIAGGFNWGPQDEKDSIDTLRTAYEAGINFFDTARGYGDGRSEQLITKALGSERQNIILASKASPNELSYDDLIKACEDRIQALDTDYIDLFQIHWPNWDIPVAESVEALELLKQQGKIRAYGMSNFGSKDLNDAVKAGAKISSNQLPYNLLWRAIEYEVIPTCLENDVPVLCYMPIMQGLLAGKFKSPKQVPEDRARTRHFSRQWGQVRHGEEGQEELTFETIDKIRQLADQAGVSMADLSMAWLLAQPGVASLIVGARNPGQVQRNLNALSVQLDPATIHKLNEITAPLKQKLGKNPDMWQGGKDSRVR